MADPALKTSYRRAVRTDLNRLSGPFLLANQRVTTGTAVQLVPLGAAALVCLAADVVTSQVTLAPMTSGQHRGTLWVMQDNADGTWSFLNQGQQESMLAGSADTVTLGRAPASSGMDRFATTRWLVYQDIAGFRLRPAMRAAGWFGLRGQALVLSDREAQVDLSLYWSLRPLPVAPVPADPELSAAKSVPDILA